MEIEASLSVGYRLVHRVKAFCNLNPFPKPHQTHTTHPTSHIGYLNGNLRYGIAPILDACFSIKAWRPLALDSAAMSQASIQKLTLLLDISGALPQPDLRPSHRPTFKDQRYLWAMHNASIENLFSWNRHADRNLFVFSQSSPAGDLPLHLPISAHFSFVQIKLRCPGMIGQLIIHCEQI